MKRLITSVINIKRLVRVLIIVTALFSVYIYTRMLDDTDHTTRKHLNLLYVKRDVSASDSLKSSPVGSTPKLVLQTQRETNHPFLYSTTPFSNVTNQPHQNMSTYFHLTQSDHVDPWLNLHQFKYLINAKACKQNVYVLVFVHSAPHKVEERNQIRMAWGGNKIFNGKHFKTVFMLGDPQKKSVQRAVCNEALTWKDIVQGDFKDTYRNLTYKHIMGLSWVTTYCSSVSYILKTDDDTMVNVYNMVNYLTKIKPTKNFLYCRLFTYATPIRYESKWRVSYLEYPFVRYPYYCEGFAYILTPDVAVRFLKVSKKAKFFWIDDVFITGILNIDAKVPISGMRDGNGYDVMSMIYHGTNVRNVMFILSTDKRGLKSWNSVWQAISRYA